jgi:hypothetical protein
VICTECRNGRHKKCAWPASCPCQHRAAGTGIEKRVEKENENEQ